MKRHQFSPPGSRDHTARLWDTATGQPLGPPLTHRGPVYAVAFSPDGKTVITGSWDNTARLWDATTGRPLGPPLTHRSMVYSVAFSPDGNTVLTGCRDNTARLWDASTGQPLGGPMTHLGRPITQKSGVEAVAFSPDGKTVATGSGDQTARLWVVATALPDELERVATWVEVITGLELDELGSARVLDDATWLQRREKLKQLGGPPVARSERWIASKRRANTTLCLENPLKGDGCGDYSLLRESDSETGTRVRSSRPEAVILLQLEALVAASREVHCGGGRLGFAGHHT
jgi:hypothetical protein